MYHIDSGSTYLVIILKPKGRSVLLFFVVNKAIKCTPTYFYYLVIVSFELLKVALENDDQKMTKA